MKFPQARVALFLALASACQMVAADTVAYQRIGEFGEAAFSDINSDGAQELVLPQSSMPPLSSAQQIEQMLQVAEELERARLDRTDQRERRRELARQARTDQRVSEQADDNRDYIYPYAHPNHPHHRPPYKPDPETPAPPTKTFRFQPDF